MFNKMQFRFWGICKWCGKLQGDSTELTNIEDWVRSRNIDLSEPHGERPIDQQMEMDYACHPEYVPQYLVDTFFD